MVVEPELIHSAYKVSRREGQTFRHEWSEGEAVTGPNRQRCYQSGQEDARQPPPSNGAALAPDIQMFDRRRR